MFVDEDFVGKELTETELAKLGLYMIQQLIQERKELLNFKREWVIT